MSRPDQYEQALTAGAKRVQLKIERALENEADAISRRFPVKYEDVIMDLIDEMKHPYT